MSSNRPLQCTSLDLWCVCDAPQNCPILQNFMYTLHEFCTFPVIEGNKILHLHFSLWLQAESSSKNPRISSNSSPKSHEFLKPLNYSQLETRESSKVNSERHKFPANALIDPYQLSSTRKVPFWILHYSCYAPTFKTICSTSSFKTIPQV